MNPEDILKQVHAQMGAQQQPDPKIDQNKLDTFIDRCCNEKDETLFTLGQALVFKLKHQPHSIEEAWIYPQVLQRIEERLNKGES